MASLVHDFPAINLEPVTERHARICREQGHATHTVDGVTQVHCPRCGEPAEVTDTEKFDRMVQLEADAKVSYAVSAMGRFPWERARAADRLDAVKAELFALLDSLTPAEQQAYAQYRR